MGYVPISQFRISGNQGIRMQDIREAGYRVMATNTPSAVPMGRLTVLIT